MCKNKKWQKQTYVKLGVGNSDIVGWGSFAKQNLKKDDLIGEYIGELLGNEETNERSELIDFEKTTYLFTVNDSNTVDSRTMGNILRFSNHSKKRANAYAKVVFANGNHRICLFAGTNIKKDTEILFDYDGANVLGKKYDWINDDSSFDEKKKIKSKKKVIDYIDDKKKKALKKKRLRDYICCNYSSKKLQEEINKGKNIVNDFFHEFQSKINSK